MTRTFCMICEKNFRGQETVCPACGSPTEPGTGIELIKSLLILAGTLGVFALLTLALKQF